QRAMRILTNHALDPEERADTVATCDRLNSKQTRGRIENHVPRGQLHALLSVVVFNDEFPAVVVLGRREEDRRAEISADSLSCRRKLTNRGVHVRAEGLATGVAVEHRR